MPKKRRSCKNGLLIFYYIRGELTVLKYQMNLTDKIKRLYYAYIGCAFGDQDKVWSPHYCLVDCSGKLNKWFSRKKSRYRYGIRCAYDLARAKRPHH